MAWQVKSTTTITITRAKAGGCAQRCLPNGNSICTVRNTPRLSIRMEGVAPHFGIRFLFQSLDLR